MCGCFSGYTHMREAPVLQSLWPVDPPMARTWNRYIVPGISPATVIDLELVNRPAGCQSPGMLPALIAAARTS